MSPTTPLITPGKSISSCQLARRDSRFHQFVCPPDTIGHVPDTVPDIQNAVFERKTKAGRPDTFAGHGLKVFNNKQLQCILPPKSTPLCPDTRFDHSRARGQRTPMRAGCLSQHRLVQLILTVMAILISATTNHSLQAGFAEADIKPDAKARDVCLAGDGQIRKVAGVQNSLFVRAVVFKHGLMLPTVDRNHAEVKYYDDVIVSATHNNDL